MLVIWQNKHFFCFLYTFAVKRTSFHSNSVLGYISFLQNLKVKTENLRIILSCDGFFISPVLLYSFSTYHIYSKSSKTLDLEMCHTGIPFASVEFELYFSIRLFKWLFVTEVLWLRMTITLKYCPRITISNKHNAEFRRLYILFLSYMCAFSMSR